MTLSRGDDAPNPETLQIPLPQPPRTGTPSRSDPQHTQHSPSVTMRVQHQKVGKIEGYKPLESAFSRRAQQLACRRPSLEFSEYKHDLQSSWRDTAILVARKAPTPCKRPRRNLEECHGRARDAFGKINTATLQMQRACPASGASAGNGTSRFLRQLITVCRRKSSSSSGAPPPMVIKDGWRTLPNLNAPAKTQTRKKKRDGFVKRTNSFKLRPSSRPGTVLIRA